MGIETSRPVSAATPVSATYASIDALLARKQVPQEYRAFYRKHLWTSVNEYCQKRWEDVREISQRPNLIDRIVKQYRFGCQDYINLIVLRMDEGSKLTLHFLQSLVVGQKPAEEGFPHPLLRPVVNEFADKVRLAPTDRKIDKEGKVESDRDYRERTVDKLFPQDPLNIYHLIVEPPKGELPAKNPFGIVENQEVESANGESTSVSPANLSSSSSSENVTASVATPALSSVTLALLKRSTDGLKADPQPIRPIEQISPPSSYASRSPLKSE